MTGSSRRLGIAIVLSVSLLGKSYGADSLFVSEWTATLVVECSSGRAVLSFGTRSLANDAYDAQYDTASPPPPPGGFYAAFAISGFPNFLSSDFRASSAPDHEWRLLVVGCDSFRLEWNVVSFPILPEDVPYGTLGELSLLSGDSTIIDMEHHGSAKLGSGQPLLIRFRAPARISFSNLRENDQQGVPLLINRKIRITGIVTASKDFGRNGPVFLQDDFPGEYGFAVMDSALAAMSNPGDIVAVEGTVSQLHGSSILCPIDTFKVVGRFQWPPDTIRVLQACLLGDSVGEQLEGLLVRINGVQFLGSGSFPADSTVNAIDQSGDTVVVYVDKETGIPGQPIPHRPVDIQGIVWQFDSDPPYTCGYWLMPRSIGEATAVNIRSDMGAFNLPSTPGLFRNYPNPSRGRTLFTYELNQSASVAIEILDMRGRLLKTETLGRKGRGRWKYQWDGRDDTGRLLPAGIYLYVLRVNGRIAAANKAVILR